MTMVITINITGEPLSSADLHRRPCLLGCTRVDGSISISDTSTYPIDTIEVTLEGKLEAFNYIYVSPNKLMCPEKGLVMTWVKHNDPRAIFSSSLITR
jgi:hypothetical protein